jgi:hypothetical protein
MGGSSSSGVTSTTTDGDSPGERWRRPRRGQDGRTVKWGARITVVSLTVLQINSAHASVQKLARERSHRRGAGRRRSGRGRVSQTCDIIVDVIILILAVFPGTWQEEPIRPGGTESAETSAIVQTC